MSDFEMPMSIITRLAKDGQSAATENVLIGKDCKKALSQLSGYFSIYIYSM